ncbi:hypothetical protein JCM10908_005454 [Rhodotorula pacifica]|uniref:uncharacterized protein n=1 Tax=Rhodotorula pacifica TaxID=1495444 RepID=UPI0031775F7B
MAPTGGTRKRAQREYYFALAAVLVLNLVCYRALNPLRQTASGIHASHHDAASRSIPRALSRRMLVGDQGGGQHDSDDSEALIDWLQLYLHATAGPHRIAVFSLMILWLVFLFAFVGICASEFFCPNLSHISSRLGLSESVAGVTFLAFSNGSPDVFSTFSALRSNSGSLAIGELLGAASFITSVVAGTMALITPFRVQRRTFLRDVGFFSIAVTLTLCILYDSHIHLWEALLMVGLYVVYVLFVAVGSWWESRTNEKKRRLREARGEYEDEDLDNIVEGDVEWEGTGQIALPTSGASTPTSEYAGRAGSPSSTLRNVFVSPMMTPPYSPDPSGMTRSQSQSSVTRGAQALRPPPTPLIHQHRRKRSRSVRPSLLGAIEFADVVHSLSSDQANAANVLAVFGGGHQHHAHSHDVVEDWSEHPNGHVAPIAGRGRAHSQPGVVQLSGGEDTLANGVLRNAQQRAEGARRAPLGPRRTTWTGPGDSTDEEAEAGAKSGVIDLSKGVEDPWKDARSPLPRQGHARTRSAATVPSIYLTTDNGSATALDGTRSSSEATIRPATAVAPIDPRPRPTRRQLLHALLGALFPSLQAFTSKSLIGKITALLCVPALLALNLTLPVAEEPTCDDDCSWTEEKQDAGDAEREGRPAHANDEAAIERIGRTLHSPATVHGHEHDASPTHRLQHIRAEAAEADAPSPSLAWGEVTRDPVESLNLGSPAVALQQNPLEEFGVIQSPAAVEETSRLEMQPQAVIEQEALAREHVTRTLTAMQCALGPVFVVTALLADDLAWYYPLVAFAVGLFFAFLAYRFFTDTRHRGRIILSFLGFGIAMVWILMIVNEVVGVLQTLGHIFGISDAILGLTIFAMGNSLGDLVANATVARMGYPAMAVAACFGGPMLNILLGVGLSGTYLILLGPARGQPIHVPMGRTLCVSGVGLLAILLATLVFVPLNGYRMSKRVGASLIVAYICLLCTNVAVEIWL